MAKLKVGDKVPDFSATAEDGSTIRLADLIGRRSLVLFFYPKDGSPICTKEVCSFRDSYEQFVHAGAEVIGVSSDSTTSHQSFARQHKLPFRLISDTDGSLRKAFGVPTTARVLPGRATYVIDAEGVLRLAFSAQFASREHVEQALRVLG